MKTRFYKISNWYQNANIRKKTLIAFLLLSLIPITILGGYSFYQTRYLLMKQEESNLQASLKQTVLTFENQLEMYNHIIRTLSFTQELVKAANYNYDSPYSMFEQINYVIDPIFLTTRNLNKGIDGITLYTGTNLTQHGTTVLPVEYLDEIPMYEKVRGTTDILWYAQEDQLLCIKSILTIITPSPKENVLVMSINKEELFGFLDTEPSRDFLVMDELNHVVFHSDPQALEMMDEILAATRNSFRFENVTFSSYNFPIPSTNWTVYFYTPIKEFNSATQRMLIFTLLLVLGTSLLVLCVSTLYARKMVRRIEELRVNMQTIEEGILDVSVFSDSADEIGELIHGFDKMVNRIRYLIHEVYTAKLLEKEAEIKALQAQIHPHFLYNSLSLINWRAIHIGAQDISEMTLLLSSFYRTTVNKGETLTSIADELTNVQSYLKIQLIMHRNTFDVEYEIEESLKTSKIPNMMLQPLAENALIHGIEKKTSGKGLLNITCIRYENDIMFRVSDNGPGIPAVLLPTLLEKQSKGYGIKNVNDRARLLYGDKYGLTIESSGQTGTTFFLRLPSDL